MGDVHVFIGHNPAPSHRGQAGLASCIADAWVKVTLDLECKTIGTITHYFGLGVAIVECLGRGACCTPVCRGP